MKPSRLLPLTSLAPATARAAASSGPLAHEYVFQNPPADATPLWRIPTPYESAVLGRRILALTPLATFSTVFPSSSSSSSGGGSSSVPNDVGGVPVGLSDYIADCEDRGNPTILSLRIGTSFRNVAHGSNISVSLAWTPPYPPDRRIRSARSSLPSSVLGYLRSFFSSSQQDDQESRKDPVPYSAANLPRFSLLGYLEKMDEPSSFPSIAACYVAAHPDAKYWLPGNPIHKAEWARLVVTKVYWIGGFGDRAYIGWIPVEDWKRITREEWEAVRLPGEKPGWNEWSVAQGVGGLADL